MVSSVHLKPSFLVIRDRICASWFSILLVEEKKLLESIREAVGYMYYFNPWISEHMLIRLKLMSTQSLFFPEYTTSSINKTEKDNSSSMKEVIK